MSGFEGCGSSCCRYAKKGGVRVNGPCRCDECPVCGRNIRPGLPWAKHSDRCTQKDWLPPHQRKRDDPDTCGSCGAIAGGNEDCDECAEWVRRDAKEKR